MQGCRGAGVQGWRGGKVEGERDGEMQGMERWLEGGREAERLREKRKG